MDWKTWIPFQSNISKEICEHMTEEERKKLSARSGKYGIWCALTAAIPISMAVFNRTTIWFVVAGILLAVHIIVIPIWRNKQKKFLCSTQWAKSKGYGIQDLSC
jgi:hypothetical protein